MRLTPRAALRRLSPISRRDTRIESLRTRVKTLEAQLSAPRESAEQPSFQRLIHVDRRIGDHLVELGRPWTRVGVLGKLTDYALAASHGIDVPHELGRWDDPADIQWSDLPDRVVVKSAFGSFSRGVFPLQRVESGWQIITRDEVVTGEQVSARLSALTAKGRERGPYFAEEFLDDGTGSPPNDTRVWAFYGEMGLIALRNAAEHGRTARFRFLRPDGTNAIDQHPSLPTDPSIPVPPALDELVDTAARLSVALRAPCLRIDLYRVGDRIVLGEVTRRPGGTQWHGSAVDLWLGETWERAEARLRRDLADGMSLEPEWGPFAAEPQE